MAANHASIDRLRILAARVDDLRAEFEAQLRSVARIEENLGRTRDGGDDSRRRLGETLRRELSGMLTNNSNIRGVLNELAKDVQRARTAV